MIKSGDIQIRDPFVLLEDGKYYLYGTTDSNPWEGKATGFNAYISDDLTHWEGPYPVFSAENGFWADENFWAPEVFRYGENFYMIASFKAQEKNRACHILKSCSPLGPFIPMAQPITPSDWWCLDGTLLIEQGKPWLVFCREWLQVNDGQIYAMQLKDDLTEPAGKPRLLFSASQAPWVKEIGIDKISGHKNYVTDGPFLLQLGDGRLSMIWSSFSGKGYAIGQVISSGGILGKWDHQSTPLYDKNGGHGMIFKTKENQWKLTFHYPNDSPLERPVFWNLTERNGALSIDQE